MGRRRQEAEIISTAATPSATATRLVRCGLLRLQSGCGCGFYSIFLSMDCSCSSLNSYNSVGLQPAEHAHCYRTYVRSRVRARGVCRGRGRGMQMQLAGAELHLDTCNLQGRRTIDCMPASANC
jgi:hypothetical protein